MKENGPVACGTRPVGGLGTIRAQGKVTGNFSPNVGTPGTECLELRWTHAMRYAQWWHFQMPYGKGMLPRRGELVGEHQLVFQGATVLLMFFRKQFQ